MTETGSSERGVARILVVDDSLAVTLLVRVLEHGGYRDVTGTTDSTEIVALVDRLSPDLLVTHLTMPPPGGMELIVALSRRTAQERPAILVLSGDTRPETQQRVLPAGAQAVITKPFELAELLARVAELIDPSEP